ncbi:hypothetical protein PIB30_053044 [Stylosanthes scabra]|uniref:Uncharacterized protein n=1 Tax=Stylosanthes scabra TaxID=79078 RepID=A0ABU6TIW1_9FABA|nr:hypothetical protein [Stylosanthes scabra]
MAIKRVRVIRSEGCFNTRQLEPKEREGSREIERKRLAEKETQQDVVNHGCCMVTLRLSRWAIQHDSSVSRRPTSVPNQGPSQARPFNVSSARPQRDYVTQGRPNHAWITPQRDSSVVLT